MDGLFGDGLVDVLCCGGDSLEEDLRWGPILGALVDLVEFEDGVTNGGVLNSKGSRPGLYDVGSLFMPDRFHESDTENALECGCLHKELYRIREQSVSDSYGAV